jgi:hypothetical protein
VWIFPRDEGQPVVGYGVVIDNGMGTLESDRKARANYFYQLQGTVGSKSLKVIKADTPPNNKNIIFGYDLENGQDQPEAFTTGGSSTQPAPFLFWIDSHGFVHFSNSSSSLSSGMDGAMEYLSSELKFTIGTTPHILAS